MSNDAMLNFADCLILSFVPVIGCRFVPPHPLVRPLLVFACPKVCSLPVSGSLCFPPSRFVHHCSTRLVGSRSVACLPLVVLCVCLGGGVA